MSFFAKLVAMFMASLRAPPNLTNNPDFGALVHDAAALDHQ